MAGKIKGVTEEARGINAFLDVLKLKVYNYQKEILRDDKPFSVQTLHEKWFGTNERIAGKTHGQAGMHDLGENHWNNIGFQ
jgi:hypothetical protein